MQNTEIYCLNPLVAVINDAFDAVTAEHILATARKADSACSWSCAISTMLKKVVKQDFQP